jgi:hypothetical protein
MSDEEFLFIGADCPKGHRPQQTFTRVQLRHLLETERLKFRCGICRSDFPLSDEAKQSLWRQVTRGSK